MHHRGSIYVLVDGQLAIVSQMQYVYAYAVVVGRSTSIQGFAKWLLQTAFDSQLTFELRPCFMHNKEQLAIQLVLSQ